MGANMSGLEQPHGLMHAKPASQFMGTNVLKTNQLMEFHSQTQWKAHFDASKETNKLLVVYFTAPWCGPCKLLEPYVKELASKYTDVEFIKIDVDKLGEVAREFELVDVVPTLILVKKGKEVDRVVGAKREELQMKTEKHRMN